MDDQVIVDEVRNILLGLFGQAMREQWNDQQSWEATSAAVEVAYARFGVAGVTAFSELQRRTYRLFIHSPAAEDVERERRAARRVRAGGRKVARGGSSA